MWLISIFILFTVPNNGVSGTLPKDLHKSIVKSYEIVTSEKESDDTHRNVMSKGLKSSPFSIKLTKHLDDTFTLADNILISSPGMRSYPPPFLWLNAGSNRTNSEKATLNPKTSDDKDISTGVYLTNRLLDTRNQSSSFLVGEFTQLDSLAIISITADASSFWNRFNSLIYDQASVASVDIVPFKESLQINGFPASKITDFVQVWHDSPEMSGQTNRNSPEINADSYKRDPPGQVTDLSAVSGGPDRIVLTWSAPSDVGGQGRTITGYRIQRIVRSEGKPTFIENNYQGGTTYTDTGLSENVEYCYYVGAINDDPDINNREGSFPDEPKCTRTSKVKPDQPTAPSATSGGPTSIIITWKAPLNNGGAAITKFKIEVSNDGNTGWTDLVDNLGADATTYTHTGLLAETRRYYQIRATNSIGTSEPSQVVSATTDEAVAPGAPTGLQAQAGGPTSITLTWTAPTNTGGANITGYKIDVSPDGSSNWTNLVASHNTTSYSHTGLTGGNTRHYRVSAINSAGTGPASSSVSGTTSAITRPDPPTDMEASVNGYHQVSLVWTAPSNTGGATISGYKIEWSSNGTDWSNLVGNTNSTNEFYAHISSRLTPNSTFHYRVSAINSVGAGMPSEVSMITAVGPSGTGIPENVSATLTSSGEISVSWSEASDLTNSESVSAYTVLKSENNGDSWERAGAPVLGTTTSYTDSGPFTVGSTHGYRIRAIIEPGTRLTSMSDEAYIIFAVVPDAPTSLRATASGQTAIRLTWTAPTNTGGATISGYKIEVSPNGNTAWTNLVENTSSTATSYIHAGLTAGVTRHYRVSAINSAGTGSASSTASASTSVATAPGAPTGLSGVAAGPTSITLTWTAPINTGGVAITGYKIEVSPNGNSGWADLEANTASTETRYTHAGLTAGVTRHYRVSAINSVGTGSASITVSAATSVATAPGAPTPLSATAAGPTSINLSWTAPTNTGGASITGYKIEVSPNGTSNWVDLVDNTGSSATTYTHAGLTANATRHYRVSAINSAGTGSASSTASATTSAATSPGAPTALSAVAAGPTSITLSWTAPTNTGGVAITGYKIEVSPNGNSAWTNLVENTASTATRYTHTGLTATTTRHYRVSAINSVGTGSASTTVSATTDAFNATRPQAPISLTASASGRTTITLSWTAPSSDGGASISAYAIEVSSDGASTWGNLVSNSGSTSTTYLHTGLTASSTRSYRVRAINSVGSSDPSNVVNATTDAVSAPSAPTALTATAQGSTIINLQWVAPIDDGGVAIRGYKIEVSSDGTSSWTNLVDDTNSATISYSHTGLTAGVTRHYRVSAINAVGTGPVSNIVNATTSSATAPSAPTSLLATATGPTSIDLSWTAPSDNGGVPITAYLIEVSPNGTSGWTNLETNTGSAATEYMHSGLAGATAYHYRVSAINSGGTGSPSNVASATTSASTVPDVPSSLTAVATSTTTIDLSWIAPLNNGGALITGYNIETSPDGTASSWSDLISNTSETLTTYTDNSLQPNRTRYYRVSAINSVGASSPSNVANATTNKSSSLAFSSASIPAQFYPIGRPIQGLVLPMATGGTPPYFYELTPALPSGLSFDAQTRTIRGTPMEITEAKTFTLSVEDAERDTDTIEFSIEVYKITFEIQIDNQVYVLGQLIEPFVLPRVTGGRDPIQYALTPLDSLPVGLRFNLSTRTISGTPERIKSPVELTYSAKDNNGAQDSLQFSIEVISPVAIQQETGLPQYFIVQTNYPNPFVHSTNLVVDLPWSAQVHAQVMDMTGRRVYSNPPITMTAGWAQKLEIKDLNLPSGAYLYRVTATSLENHASSIYVGQFMKVQ